jgi:hypothetical protein
VVLPTHNDDEELANRFGDFFLGKIETIRDYLKASRESLHSPDVLSVDVVFALRNSSEYQSVFGHKMILLD